jgi:hypothetical protein
MAGNGFLRVTGTVAYINLKKGGTPDTTKLIFDMSDRETRLILETPGAHEEAVFNAMSSAVISAYFHQTEIVVDYYPESVPDTDEISIPERTRLATHKVHVLQLFAR